MKSILIPLLIAITHTADTVIPGYISNDPDLVKMCPKPDKRCPMHKGKLSQNHIRGLIGITYNPATGEILYIYPNSDILKYGIQTGDIILKVEKENFRPCILPGIQIYSAGYILNLTVRTKAGIIKTIPVELIPMKSIQGDT